MPQAKNFAWGVSLIVAIAVIGGFFVAGSPFKQRLVRFDSQKVSDLQAIQYEILRFWQQKDRLPTALSELEDSITGFRVPMDPQTNGSYVYHAREALSFELCATFNLPSEESRVAVPRFEPIGFPESNWEHPEGEYCFPRTIDPELHSVEKAFIR